MSFEPNQDLESYIAQQVQAQLTNVGRPADQQQPLQQAQPQPLALNLLGQNMQFKDLNELQTGLNNALSQVSQQNAALQAQIEQAKTQGQQATVSGTEQAPTWDVENFVSQMTTDPRKGLNYALNHLLFDGKAEDAAGELKQILGENEQVKRTMAAYQFVQNHPEYAAVANPQAYATIEKWRTAMNLPYDVNGLEAAYLMAVNKGPQNGGLPNLPAMYQQQKMMDQVRQQSGPQGQYPGQAPQQFQQQSGYVPPAQQNYGPPQQSFYQPQTQFSDIPNAPMDPRVFNGGGGLAGLNNPYLAAPPGMPRTGAPGFGGGPISQDQAEMLSPEQIENVFQQVERMPPQQQQYQAFPPQYPRW